MNLVHSLVLTLFYFPFYALLFSYSCYPYSRNSWMSKKENFWNEIVKLPVSFPQINQSLKYFEEMMHSLYYSLMYSINILNVSREMIILKTCIVFL